MISSFDPTSYGSGNQKGFYSVFLNDDGSSNIMYTDYATQTQVYLCAKPNCEHDSDACTSWIAPFAGTIVPAATEKDLFLIYSSREERPKIERLELNGENPTTVFSLPDGAKIQNAVAASDTTLIVQIEQYENDGQNIKSNCYLAAISWETGKISVVFSLNDELEQLKNKKFQASSMLFYGATSDALIVETIVQFDYEVDMNDVDKSFENLNKALEHTVYKIPLDGSEPSPILSYSNGQCVGRAFPDGFFYVEESKNHTISMKKILTSTEEHQLLIENLSEALFTENAEQLNVEDIVFRNYVDGHLLFNVLTDQYISNNGNIELVFSGFAIDVETGVLKQINLTNYYNATTVPVDIIAKCGDDLLVFADITQSSGENKNSRLIERKIALITTEDYLDSKPNYRMIDTLRNFA